ncbi:DNA-methyltransferase [Novosphingobium sp.]|uniref:DNA-methyltransferase n=1 Tax=Novosphingobium sp. TaxID=1874826 RepID=UPI002FDA1C4F
MTGIPKSVLTTCVDEAIAASAAGSEFVIYNGPCEELMREIPSKSVDLFVTSPPYFMGKEYDRSYELDDFYEDIRNISGDTVRIVKEGGNFCWQVGNHVGKASILPLDFAIYEVFREQTEIALRNRIIWHFGHGTHAKKRFSGRHETIMWYGKGSDSYFDLDAVRVPQKYPGKRHYKGPNKGEFSGHPQGKNPSDVWEIPNVKANHCEKTAHPCQFPVALAQRLVRALARADGLVFDPFSGSGSSGIAAALEGRRYLGSDTSAEYCHIALDRFEALRSGKLAIRPLDRDIYQPSERAAVAQRPDHFAFQE